MTQTKILSHPRWGQYANPDDQLVFETKMVWKQVINKAVLGTVILTEENKEVIRTLNALLKKHGWTPIEKDFETL